MEAKNTQYATSSDFCRIFQSDMDRLYLLALLLTGNAELAEQCFVGGLEDARNGNRVFKEWAEAWSRRTIIKNAIRAVRPVPNATAQTPGSVEIGFLAQIPQIRALFTLSAFERFVFVVTVLEGYSDRDCALLFNSTRQAVVSARVRALEVTGDPGGVREQLEAVAIPAQRAYGFSPEIFAAA